MRIIRIDHLGEARTELERIGADPQGIDLMAPKLVHRVVRVEDVPLKAALVLKQEMLSLGGEAAVNRGVAGLSVQETDVILAGTLRQMRLLGEKLRQQPFGLARLAGELGEALEHWEQGQKSFKARDVSLPLGEKTYILGILNVTPNSFSDGGKHLDPGEAVEAAKAMVDQGADIIDVGAESTHPGVEPVPAEEEWRRLEPVLSRLVKEIKTPISVDTYKAAVAARALDMGAQIINDVSGLQADPRMAQTVGRAGGSVIIMHWKGDPRVMQDNPTYTSLMDEIIAYLEHGIELAQEAGIKPDSIIVDPGIGFGKTVEHNLEIMRRQRELKILGCPVLMATSRKGFIGKVLNLPVDQRVEGTGATVAVAIANGADFVRVHDVLPARRVADMADSIIRRSM